MAMTMPSQWPTDCPPPPSNENYAEDTLYVGWSHSLGVAACDNLVIISRDNLFDWFFDFDLTATNNPMQPKQKHFAC